MYHTYLLEADGGELAVGYLAVILQTLVHVLLETEMEPGTQNPTSKNIYPAPARRRTEEQQTKHTHVNVQNSSTCTCSSKTTIQFPSKIDTLQKKQKAGGREQTAAAHLLVAWGTS